MIEPYAALAVGVSLLIAGLLEFACIVRGTADVWLTSRMMMLALLMLGGRVTYLFFAGETTRLNMWGMGPIAMIAMSRIMASVALLRMRMTPAPAVARALLERAAEDARKVLSDAAVRAAHLLSERKQGD